MLRKRTRSTQKDQQMYQIPSSESGSVSDVTGQRQKTNSFYNVPGLFIGLSPQVISDCDSVRSPTSPLDFKLFSNLGNSLIRFPKSSQEVPQKSWDSNKVGLGSIVDYSLDDGGSNNFVNNREKYVPCSSSKTILFGTQIRSKAPNSPTYNYNALFCEAPKSLPKNYEFFSPHAANMMSSNVRKGSTNVSIEIGDHKPLEFDPFEKIQSFSLDSRRAGLDMLRLGASLNVLTDFKSKQSNLGCDTSLALSLGGANYNYTENKLTSSSPLSIASGNAFVPALTPSEIELSEDYTRVISHGPNPKTTHIFGDCVLGCHPIIVDCGNTKKEISEIGLPFSAKSSEISPRSPYPSYDFLSFCCFCKKKLEGADIYMYRGEKAFCSSECRSEGISIEEKKEKPIRSEQPPKEACESENGDNSFEKSIFVAI